MIMIANTSMINIANMTVIIIANTSMINSAKTTNISTTKTTVIIIVNTIKCVCLFFCLFVWFFYSVCHNKTPRQIHGTHWI